MSRIANNRLALLAAGSLVAAVVVIAALALRDQIAEAAGELGHGDPLLLGGAAVLFGNSLLLNAESWRRGLTAATGRAMSPVDASARYAVGSLGNSLLPFHGGTVLRITLFARAAGDLRAVTGVVAAAGSVGAVGVALMVVCTAGISPLPAWSALLVAAGATVYAVISLVAARAPLRNRGLAGAVIGALVARIGGVAVLLAAYDVRRALVVGTLVVVALEVAGTAALTPGNMGVSTAAVSVMLVAQGVPQTLALTVGIALPAVETAASVALGVAGVACLARRGELPRVALRRTAVAADPA